MSGNRKRFNKKKIQVKSRVINFKNWKLIVFDFNLNLNEINKSKNFKYVGYLREYKSNDKSWAQIEHMQTEDVNKLNYEAIWYCISNQKNVLPKELKNLSINNIDANLVPSSCRW